MSNIAETSHDDSPAVVGSFRETTLSIDICNAHAECTLYTCTSQRERSDSVGVVVVVMIHAVIVISLKVSSGSN